MLVIIAIIATLVIVAPITWFISGKVIQKANDAKIGNANERAREIIDEALKTAETTKKEALLKRRPKKEELKYRSMKEEFFLRKNPLTRKLKLSKSVT